MRGGRLGSFVVPGWLLLLAVLFVFGCSVWATVAGAPWSGAALALFGLWGWWKFR